MAVLGNIDFVCQFQAYYNLGKPQKLVGHFITTKFQANNRVNGSVVVQLLLHPS